MIQAWIPIVILAFVGIALAAHYYSGDAKLKRAIRDAQLFTCATLPENTVGKLKGRAYPLHHTLAGPLTGRPCLYYRATVEEQRSSGKNSYWKTIIREEQGVPFQLIDGSGRAFIDPQGAQLALDNDGASRSGAFDDATPVEEAFLARHGYKSKGWVFNKQIRYNEAIIAVEEPIAVLGAAVREPDPEAPPTASAYREGPPTRLRMMASPQMPLRITDDREVASLV